MTAMEISRRTMVGGMVATAAAMPFAPALAAHRPLSFLAMGDWGRDGNQHQRDVAIAVKNSREMALLPYTSTAR